MNKSQRNSEPERKSDSVPAARKAEPDPGAAVEPAARCAPAPKASHTVELKPEKARAVETAIGDVHKAHGPAALMRLGEASCAPVAVIPTGSLLLDRALGIGGYPRGRILEIFGPESSGKTTLTLHAIAEAQALGGVAAFIDAEHAFDLRYARSIGVDPARLLVSQPDNGEQALEIADILAKSQAVDLIVVDSVAALVPRAEIEGDMGDSHMGLHARLMSQALRKLNGAVAKGNTALIFINQLRLKIGVVFGNPETTTGGNALKFYASVRLDVRRIGKTTAGDTVVGNRTRVRVVKNKCAPPFGEAEFDIRWGTGIDKAGDLVDAALVTGALEKSGSHLLLDGKSMAQGREKARDLVAGDEKLRRALGGRVAEHWPPAPGHLEKAA
ncbi:MAG TPA: recombinase RecA [Polyangiaceae bacterium]